MSRAGMRALLLLNAVMGYSVFVKVTLSCPRSQASTFVCFYLMPDHGRTSVIAPTFVEQNVKYLGLDQPSHTQLFEMNFTSGE